VSRKSIAVFLALFALLAPVCAQYSSEFSSSGAREELRLGVQAYHQGRYAESILLFEKALAYGPSEPLLSYWLGRSYAKSGYESTALRAWEGLIARPDAPAFLRSKVETIQGSRSLESDEDPSFIEAARFSGRVGKTTYFLRPSGLLPQTDGSVLVVAHGSNEIVRIDPNGVIRQREKGGLEGYDRPFGIAGLPDGSFFVTEFNGDRVSRIDSINDVSRKRILFGSKGRGDGRLIGPQYAACDEDGYLYVSDYGNARIVKFDRDGKYLLSFGAKSDEFPGFASPSGIAEKQGIVYVADSYRKAVYKFDLSGNYIGSIGEGLLHAPEGLSFWRKGSALLISDTDRIASLDLETERVSTLYSSPQKGTRLVDAVADFNGNLLAADFDSSSVLVLSEAPLLAAGYNVEIERIIASEFPKVTVDVDVRDRQGMPVVGLRALNFHLTESIKSTVSTDERGRTLTRNIESLVPVQDLQLVGEGSVASPFRTVLIGDRSLAMADFRDEAREALTDLYNSLSGAGAASLSFVGAGSAPSLEVAAGRSLSDLTKALLKVEDGTKAGRIDLALRLAATSLLPTSPRSSVIYLGLGSVDDKAFAGTTLSEVANLFRNNGIRFFAVILGEGSPSESIRYLASETGGTVYSAARPRGLGDLAAEIAQGPSGRYRLTFTSKADSGFGQNYLLVGVEAYLYRKSGKDELGYFAPLE